MKNQWFKKISLGLALTLALGVAACDSQDGTDSEAGTQIVNTDGGAGQVENQGRPVEIHTDSGSLVGDGSFVSATFDDGTGIACDHGDCTF